MNNWQIKNNNKLTNKQMTNTLLPKIALKYISYILKLTK